MKFNIIVACTPSGGIGDKGFIPWHISADLKHFKEVTTSCKENKINAVIMGRKTWESLSCNSLPNRINFVVSSTLVTIRDAHIARDLNDAINQIKLYDNIDKVFVIGGSSLYKEGLLRDDCERVYLTLVQKEYVCDTFFPLNLLFKYYSLVDSKKDAVNNISYLEYKKNK